MARSAKSTINTLTLLITARDDRENLSERGMQVELGARPRVPNAPMFGDARVPRKMEMGMGKSFDAVGNGDECVLMMMVF